MFDILNFKAKEEIIEIVRDLGSHKMTTTSHNYSEYKDMLISDVAKLASDNYFDKAKTNPAIVLIEVVLAANRNYNKAVRPKIKKIESEHPNLKSFNDIEELINKLSKEEFFNFWGHKDEKKYKTLKSILEAIAHLKKDFPGYTTDYKLMNNWAAKANYTQVKSDIIGKIPNINIATFQHLRMNFGIDTVKPDQRVKEVLEYEFKLPISNDIDNIIAVEQIAKITAYRVIEIDQIFVKFGSGYYNRTKKINLKEIGKKLKESGVSIDIISEATTLTKRQIDNL